VTKPHAKGFHRWCSGLGLSGGSLVGLAVTDMAVGGRLRLPEKPA